MLPGPGAADRAKRMFLALWPDDAVRAQLVAARRALDLNDGRLVSPQNLHATLVFLGAVDPLRRACVEQAAASAGGRSFELVLAQAEWRRGGVVWLAAAEIPAALRDLVASLNAALAACGHEPERRPYRLHVTLARDVRGRARRRAVSPIDWRAGEVCLVSSETAPDGSAYCVERRWPLL